VTKPDEVYEAILDLLMKSELAARNHQFATCGTYAEQARDLAWKAHYEEVDE